MLGPEKQLLFVNLQSYSFTVWIDFIIFASCNP